jgi:CheY-like chemotaxis protein
MTTNRPDYGDARHPVESGTESDLALPILVVDANRDISDLVRMILEDTGRYQVMQASSAQQALEVVRELPFDLVILDFNLPDLLGPELVDRLRGSQPDLEVIVIPLNEKLKDAELERTAEGEIVGKPFYLPELPAIVESALGLEGTEPLDMQSSEAEEETQEQTPEREIVEPFALPDGEGDIEAYIASALEPFGGLPQWLEEPDEAAFYLSDILLESSAIAGVLTRLGEFWAATEGLPQSQVQEITFMVREMKRDHRDSREWMRLLRHGSSGDDFRIYTTPVLADMDLTLIFPTSVPLREIRRQANRLTGMLTDVDPLSFEF